MGKPVKSDYQGRNAHRYKENPLEKAFALKWQDSNSGLGKPRTILDYLMDPSNRGEPNPPISKRDWEVANTLIQWLGSPVGQGFLVDVLAGPDGEYFRQRLQSEVDHLRRQEKETAGARK